jgi:hypothetical protein
MVVSVWVRRAALLLLTLLVALGGCTCGRKSDEELLRERIDTTSVHLYLATKIAVLKADQSPEAKKARDQLVELAETLEGKPSKDGGRAMSAGDYLTLAKLLWALRSEGQELLESGDEKGLEPLLPKLFEPSPELAEVLDLNMEHAFLLTGMFVLRFHPRSPLPIPWEVILYEAWMTDAGKLKLPAMAPFVHTIKAVAYGQTELCDLAAKETAAAEEELGRVDELAAASKTLTGKDVAVEAETARQVGASVRALGHGMAGLCYLNRDQKDEGLAEIDAMLKAADEAGIAKEDTALLRCYVALERGDREAAKVALEDAKRSKKLSDEDRKDIDALSKALSEGDDDTLGSYFDRAFLAVFASKLTLRHLDELGAFDAIENSELARTLDGYLAAAGGALSRAQELTSGESWLDKVKNLF